MRLQTRLLAGLLPPVLLAGGLLAWDAWRAGRNAVLAQVSREARALAEARTADLDRRFATTRRVTQGLADALEPDTIESLERSLNAALTATPELVGLTVVLDASLNEFGHCGAFVYRDGGALKSQRKLSHHGGLQEDPWLQQVLSHGRGLWGKPGHGWSSSAKISYGVPMRRGGRVLGVVSADLGLENLIGSLGRAPLGRKAAAFLVDANGRVLAGIRSGGVLDPKLLAMVRSPGPDFDEAVDPLGAEPAWVLEHPLPPLEIGRRDLELSLVFSYPSEELFRPLLDLRDRILRGALLLAALLPLVLAWAAGAVSGPVQALAAQARRYAGGDFAARLPEDRGVREMRDLAGAFNALGRDLVLRIEEVRAATAARARVQHELALAADLQQAVLPRTWPPFPDLADRVDLHGLMRPALEVGGDFFDLLRKPDGRLVLMVGDVSGKGVPGALFMTQTRLLLRHLAGQGLPPGEVLGRANGVLAGETPDGMFITLAYLDCDPDTGAFLLASAGHPSPAVLAPGAPPALLAHPRALPLAARAGTAYPVTTGALGPGEGLVLYSDGLTEAMDPLGREFGSGRMLAALAGLEGQDCRGITEGLRAAADAFADGAPPADDLTLLALRRRGGPQNL